MGTGAAPVRKVAPGRGAAPGDRPRAGTGAATAEEEGVRAADQRPELPEEGVIVMMAAKGGSSGGGGDGGGGGGGAAADRRHPCSLFLFSVVRLLCGCGFCSTERIYTDRRRL